MDAMNNALLQQIADVASEADEPLTAAQVAAVFAAREAVVGGDPVGTIKRGPAGEIAMRVESDGMLIWRVTVPDGTQYNDTQPTLPWPAIAQPEE